MPKFFQKFIFAFVALSLFCSFGLVASADNSGAKLEIADFESDEKSGEYEDLAKDLDLENSKYFSQTEQNLKILSASLALKKNLSDNLEKNFLAVPTSPPNA